MRRIRRREAQVSKEEGDGVFGGRGTGNGLLPSLVGKTMLWGTALFCCLLHLFNLSSFFYYYLD